MGNYLFCTDVLIEALRKDATDAGSRHDMGGDIMPMLVDQGCAQVYDFMTNKVPGASERDAGTGVTSARSTPTSTHTWTCAPSTRSSTCTTTGGRS